MKGKTRPTDSDGQQESPPLSQNKEWVLNVDAYNKTVKRPMNELLTEFFHFYSEEFNFYKEVVSIRKGISVPKLEYLYYLMTKIDVKPLGGWVGQMSGFFCVSWVWIS